MKRSIFVASGLGAFALTIGMTTQARQGSTMTEVPTPSPNSLPQGIDVDCDRIAYAESQAGAIVELSAGFEARVFILPNGGSPNVVKLDGGNIWFTDGRNRAIGRLDRGSGQIVDFAIPSGAAPFFLQLAPSGDRWFSEASGVGRLSKDGIVEEWIVSLEHPDDNIEEISLDAEGNLWFAERNFDGSGPAGTNWVRRLDPHTNVVSEYRVPTLGGNPAGILARPDGKVWVSEYFADRIALLDPAVAPHTDRVIFPNIASSKRGESRSWPERAPKNAHGSTPVLATTNRVTPIASTGWVEYPLPTTNAQVEDMRLDAHGLLAFEEDAGKIGVLDADRQTVTEYPIPTPNSGYYNIALSSNGDVWFTEAAIFASGVPSQIGVLDR